MMAGQTAANYRSHSQKLITVGPEDTRGNTAVSHMHTPLEELKHAPWLILQQQLRQLPSSV